MSGQYNVDNGIYLYEHAGGARVAYMTMGMDEPTFQSHAGRGLHMGNADGGDDSSEEDLDSRGGRTAWRRTRTRRTWTNAYYHN